jgi:hypothetical protein
MVKGATPLRVAVTPQPPRGRACYAWQLSRISRLSPQTNTSLFCALCPHSCAPGINFPVGHPSSNCSRPSTLNLEFFSDELPEKKVYLVDMSILSILLSPSQDVTVAHWTWRYPTEGNVVKTCATQKRYFMEKKIMSICTEVYHKGSFGFHHLGL